MITVALQEWIRAATCSYCAGTGRLGNCRTSVIPGAGPVRCNWSEPCEACDGSGMAVRAHGTFRNP